MSFEAVSGGDVSTLVDAMDDVDLEDDDISELHHEVFGIAGTLRHKIKELGIERKERGKVMTREQCDNISEHIDDINATWNEELKVALGKTNGEVRKLTGMYNKVMKANDHLKSKQSRTVDMLRKLAADISDLNYEYLFKFASFMRHVRMTKNEKKRCA